MSFDQLIAWKQHPRFSTEQYLQEDRGDQIADKGALLCQSDAIFIIVSFAMLQLACNINSIHKIATMWVWSFFAKGTLARTLNNQNFEEKKLFKNVHKLIPLAWQHKWRLIVCGPK